MATLDLLEVFADREVTMFGVQGTFRDLAEMCPVDLNDPRITLDAKNAFVVKVANEARLEIEPEYEAVFTHAISVQGVEQKFTVAAPRTRAVPEQAATVSLESQLKPVNAELAADYRVAIPIPHVVTERSQPLAPNIEETIVSDEQPATEVVKPQHVDPLLMVSDAPVHIKFYGRESNQVTLDADTVVSLEEIKPSPFLEITHAEEPPSDVMAAEIILAVPVAVSESRLNGNVGILRSDTASDVLSIENTVTDQVRSSRTIPMPDYDQTLESLVQLVPHEAITGDVHESQAEALPLVEQTESSSVVEAVLERLANVPSEQQPVVKDALQEVVKVIQALHEHILDPDIADVLTLDTTLLREACVRLFVALEMELEDGTLELFIQALLPHELQQIDSAPSPFAVQLERQGTREAKISAPAFSTPVRNLQGTWHQLLGKLVLRHTDQLHLLRSFAV